MRTLVTLIYLVSGFFVFALHAETLDAPTLVVQEYQEHFSAQPGRAGERQIHGYLVHHMKHTPEHKIGKLGRLILKLAKQHRFQPGLILSIIKVESNFQPWAVSRQGALGLMQIMPETGEWLARRYGIGWDGPATLLDEEKNLVLGVRYLAYLREKYNGDLKTMLMAYNRGPAKVDEEKAEGRKTTVAYYEKVKQYFPRLAIRQKAF